jgi:outer membrane protein assembly factor BamB
MSWRSWNCRAPRRWGLLGVALALALALALAVGLGACGGGTAQHAQPHTAATSADTTATDPSPAGTTSTATAAAWAAPNADLANTRRVHGPIDASSVSRLHVAWKLPITGAGYATTPVVAAGVVYLQDLSSNVYAIDANSGHVRWKATFEEQNVGPNGVTIGDGRIYGATNESLFALDAKTGRQLWLRQVIRNTAEAIDMAPAYKDGTVYVSPAVRAAGSAGVLWAVDAATGRVRWKWAEVPASLWGHPEVNAGGGLWHPPAFDERGDLYIDIANPLPFPGTEEAPWGSSRPGPNRWNNSIVKLDARTGRFLWGRQVLPHDIYDWDLECPVILKRVGGRRVALASGKMGIVYAFDAGSGALLWKRSVGLHNGHDDDNLLAMRGDTARLRYPLTVLPGNWGGVQTPMAADDATVYVPVNNLSITYGSQVEAKQQEIPQGTGEIVALDIATGHVRWDHRLPHSPYGAATVSNDVVFTTTYEGTLWAIDTATGKVLWSSPLPAGSIAPVGVSGDMLITAGSLALNARQQPQIVAYRLDR